MIRLAAPGDAGAIRELSEQVFTQFGDYGTYLPRYLEDSWVTTAVYEDEGQVRGFVMVGLTPSRRRNVGLVADILAIAVAPDAQGRGVGTALIQHGLEIARTMGERFGVREVQLSVADTNTAAQRFFTRHGFVVIDPAEGRYPAGQIAIRMARQLEPPRAFDAGR